MQAKEHKIREQGYKCDFLKLSSAIEDIGRSRGEQAILEPPQTVDTHSSQDRHKDSSTFHSKLDRAELRLNSSHPVSLDITILMAPSNPKSPL